LSMSISMRDYETIYILSPNTPEDGVEKVNVRMQEVITANGGEVVKVEKWGRRKLAYPVNKQKKGEYILYQYKGGPVTVAELERNFKMTDSVIKFMTVRLEKEMLLPPVVEAPAPVEGEATEAGTEGTAEGAAAPEATDTQVSDAPATEAEGAGE
jgi:small subunit ribosomal protein S6